MPASEMMTFKTAQSKEEKEKHTQKFLVAKPLISMLQ